MKFSDVLLAGMTLLGAAEAQVQGFDVSHWQSSVNFPATYSSGARFVYIKVSHCLPT